MLESARVSRHVIRLLATACVAGLLSACSNVDVFNPDTWGGDSATDQATTATDTGAPPAAGGQGQTVAEQNDQYPVLADTPSKAPPNSSTDEQKQVANGLVADRSQAQYSAEALQAGNEPPAAPPPPADTSTSLPATPDQGAASGAATPATPPPSAPTADAGAASSMPGTLPSSDQGAAAASAPPPSPPATQTASGAPAVSVPPPSLQPAVRAAPAAPSVMPDDAALGFQPSHAPPLDPSVAQMISGQGAPRQQRLASISPTRQSPGMSFAGSPAATVTFPANSFGLDANGVAQVQAAVTAYRAKGGQGYVRVVGHSPSGAPTLPADKQMMQSFERSQACATTVARELIKEGVPANRVLVDATSTLSDAEQRRADIFLSS